MLSRYFNIHDCHGRIVYFELQEGSKCWGIEHFIALKDHRFVT